MATFRLFLLPALLVLAAPLFGTVRYIAQSAGTVSGGSACNGQTAITPAAWNSTNESPGDISYVCGTINASAGATVLNIGWSGTSSAPIQLIFDTGAIIQAPYLNASGGIVVNGQSWVTINGGTNGIIQNTLDGTSGQNCPGGTCSVQFDSTPIYLTGCTECTVENLNIASVYVRASGDTNQYGTGINVRNSGISGASNVLIANNTIANAFSGISWSYGANESGIEIEGDTIGYTNWGIAMVSLDPLDTITGITIHDNNIHDQANWDDYPSPYNNHHSGVFIFGNQTGNGLSGCYVYNNYFYGSFGSGASPGLYLDNVSTGDFRCTAFNNVIVPSTTASGGEGGLTAQNESGSGPVDLIAYNNTLATSAASNGPSGVWVQGASMATTLENNIIYGWNYDLTTQSGASKPTSNYNAWYTGVAGLFNINGAEYSNLAAWQSVSGQDAGSISANPNLDLSTWVPNSGSPVIGLGTNLYSICAGQPKPGIGALCFDKNGAARPATGNWDAGAYQYGSVVTIPPTPGLNGFSCNPASVSQSAATTCTVALNLAAGSGGTTINLSSLPADVNMSATVTVPQGSTSTMFSVTAGTVATATPVTLTASLGGVNETFGLTVNPPALALSSVSVSPGAIVSGQSGSGTISLTEAAVGGGAMVMLSSSNSSAASVPTSVTVPSGATSANFLVTTGSVSIATPVTLTASYAGVSKTFALTVNPVPAALSAVSVSPSSIGSGQSGIGTVNLTAPAPAGGAVVTLSSSNTSAATVPASITVASGATSATFTVTAGTVNASTPVTLTASYVGVDATFALTVNPLPAALSSVSVSPGTIVSGQSGTGSVTLSTAAGPGGAVVTLSSSNPSAATVPAFVTVPQGSTTTTFTVATGTVGTGGVATSTPVTLTAMYSGVSTTFGFTVNPPPDFSLGMSPASANIAVGASTTYTVNVTALNGFGGAVNFGTSGLPAGVTGSFNPTTVTGPGSTALTIQATASASPANVTITVSGISGLLNHNTSASLTITGASSGGPPAPVSVTPNSGSGASQTFAFAFSDGHGAADISSAQIDIAGALSVSGACYLYYPHGLNEIYLASDAGVWQGPLPLGSAGMLENSQCTVDVGASSASMAGNTLTLNLALSFAAGFAGAKNVYMEVENATYDSGWTQFGTWTVAGIEESASAPAAVSVTPNSGNGAAQTFAFTFSDGNGAADISSAQIDISATLSVTGACYLYYPRGLNEIYLASDAGVWQGPLPLGSSGMLENSQCTLDVGASSASMAGNTLTLNLALSFTAGFAGAKHVYMEVENATYDSGWSAYGIWTVP
jgi:hypothetical protein